MTWWVVGAGGQVGGGLLARLDGDAIGTWRGDPPPGGRHGDLTDPTPLADAIRRERPAVVCVCAAVTWVDHAETHPDETHQVNAVAPGVLAEATAAAGGRTVLLSTDYVFDGSAGPYRPDDPPCPINRYGVAKLEGERRVLAADPRALVVRTTWVYGPEARGRNVAYRLARATGPFRVAAGESATPTYNRDLAAGLVDLVTGGERGIRHLAGPEVVDRVTWLTRLAAAAGLDVAVEGVDPASLGDRAPRPARSGLVSDRPLRTIEAAVADWLASPGGAAWPG